MKKNLVIKIIAVCLIVGSLFFYIGTNSYAKDSFGLVDINGKQMFKDQYGNLLPIWKDNTGTIYIREGGEKPGALITLKEMLKLVSVSGKNKSGSFPSTVYVFAPVSYNQEYYLWRNNKLGNSTAGWTIGNGGCFLTSTAMALATYRLYLNGKLVNPSTLNVWIREHGGFGGPTNDDLIFSALKNFPGISYTYTCTDYSDAYLAIYYGSMPVICFKRSNSSYHFCALIQTDGVASHTTVNKIINPANSDIYSERGLIQTVQESGLPWWNTPNPRFFVAVKG